MRTGQLIIVTLLVAGIGFAVFGIVHADDTLTIYAGRSKSLAEPIIQRFEEETGIKVRVKYGSTPQLAMALREEGKRSPADVFWAQDVTALESLDKAGFLAELPAALADATVPACPAKERWIATSGRARVLAYHPERAAPGALPESVLGLTGAQWEGRVGWAPANASFQAFMSALRHIHGDEVSAAWVEGMRDNGAKAYANNTALVQALAAGEVDVALTNHYYLLRFKEEDPGFPVEQVFFKEGDAGNLVNFAGVALLNSSKRRDPALKFVEFLLDEKAQGYFAHDVFEYPVNGGVTANERLIPVESLMRQAPEVQFAALDDMEGTLNLLRRAGVL